MMASTTSAEIAVLSSVVERLVQTTQENNDERRAAERAAHADRALMQERLGHVEQQLARSAERLEAIEPVVDMVTSLRAKVTGGLLVLGMIGGIGWAGLLFFKERLIALLGS